MNECKHFGEHLVRWKLSTFQEPQIALSIYLRKNASSLQLREAPTGEPGLSRCALRVCVVVICGRSTSPHQKPVREEASSIKERLKLSKGVFRSGPCSLSWLKKGSSGLSFPHTSHWLRAPLEDINAQALVTFHDFRQSGSRNSWGISKESSLCAVRSKSPQKLGGDNRTGEKRPWKSWMED